MAELKGRNQLQPILDLLRSQGARPVDIQQIENWFQTIPADQQGTVLNSLQSSARQGLPLNIVLSSARGSLNKDQSTSPGIDPLGEATGRSSAGMSPEAISAWDQLNQFIQTLPPDKQQEAIQQLKHNVQLGPGANLTTNDITGLLGGLQKAYGPQQPGQTQADPPAGATGAASYGDIKPGGEAPKQTAQIPTAPGMTSQDQPGQSVAGYPGLVQSFASLPPDVAAKMAGVDLQQLQKEYADYQSHLQKTGGGDIGDRTGSGMSFANFADMRATALQGMWRPVLDQLDMYYQQQTNTEMPADLRMKLLSQFEGMKTTNPVVYGQIRASLLNYQMAMSGLDSRPGANYGKKLPSTTNPQDVAQPFMTAILSPQQESANQSLTGGVVGTGSASSPGLIPSTIWATANDYISTHATAATIEGTQAKASAARQASYVKLLSDNNMSQYATPDLLTKLMGMSDADAQKYIANSFPYKMGMTLQQWTDASDQFKSFSVNGQKSSWQQLFGGTPSDQQIASARGMSGDQFSSWVENSKSRIDGLNVGQYVADKNAMDGIATQLFGTGATDELLKRFHSQGPWGVPEGA